MRELLLNFSSHPPHLLSIKFYSSEEQVRFGLAYCEEQVRRIWCAHQFPFTSSLTYYSFFSGEKHVRLRLGLNFSSLALFLFRHVLSKS